MIGGPSCMSLTRLGTHLGKRFPSTKVAKTMCHLELNFTTKTRQL